MMEWDFGSPTYMNIYFWLEVNYVYKQLDVFHDILIVFM